MPRLDQQLEERRLLQQVLTVGEGAPAPDEKVRTLQMLRAASNDAGLRIDTVLVNDSERSRRALTEAMAHQEKLRELLEAATAPPWHPAVFVRPCEMPEGRRAIVYFGGKTRIVNFREDLDWLTFRTGDEVFLNNDLNLLMEKSPFGMPQVGETATFQRVMDDGERVVIRHRDEELILDMAGALRDHDLETGDLVRWDRGTWMAYEKVERQVDESYLMKDIPDGRPEQVGGQRENLKQLIRAMTAALLSPDLAQRFGIPSKRSILMIGPPGCGKTLLARVGSAEVGRIGGKQVKFFIVKPAEWESMWVGETQANIRRCFDALRKHAETGYCVLFLDEVESVGRVRGSSMAGNHNDKFLAALLAEIDGFRANQNTVIISATNRKDMLDQALAERLSDVELHVRRPDLRSARDIFGIHLPASLPFSPNGDLAAKTRQQVIDIAVSRLYSPNAENQVATVKFRDSTVRTVAARELLSGRVMEQICTAAKQAAYYRALDGEEAGIQARDMDDAVDQAMTKMSTMLSRVNVRSYLDDLPQDVEVVSVTPVVRKVPRPSRFVV